jgi:hypothetical protein
LTKSDKEFLQDALQYIKNECEWHDSHIERFQSIIDNMPNTEALVAEAKKRVDILCERRKIPENVLASERYLADSYLAEQEQGFLFHPSINPSNI